MFKANGNIKAKRFQEHVETLGAKFIISVVTGPSGSYREEDILKFLTEWCEPWSDERKRELILLDAYAPGLTMQLEPCSKRGGCPVQGVSSSGSTEMNLVTNVLIRQFHTAWQSKKWKHQNCQMGIRHGSRGGYTRKASSGDPSKGLYFKRLKTLQRGETVEGIQPEPLALARGPQETWAPKTARQCNLRGSGRRASIGFIE